MLSINPMAGHVVGVKLREDGLTVAVCDLACTVVHQCEEALTVEGEPYRVVDAIASAVERCIDESGVARHGCACGGGSDGGDGWSASVPGRHVLWLW